jgi:hypothetical protein
MWDSLVVCLHVPHPTTDGQWLSKHFPAAHATTEELFCVVHVISKERRWSLLPRTSCWYTGCPRRNVPDFGGGGVPYGKVYRYNPKHLCPKLNGYGNNGQRKVWPSGGSTHCNCQLTSLINVCPWMWCGVTSVLALECNVVLRQCLPVMCHV